MKAPTLRVMGPVIVILAGCESGGSGRGDARDSGKGETTDGSAIVSTPADGSADQSDALPGAPDADARVMPFDAARTDDTATADGPGNDVTAGLNDTAATDGAGNDDDVGAADTAIADGPGNDGADGAGDAAKADLSRNDGAAGPGDLPSERTSDAGSGDTASEPTLGFRYVAPGVSFTCALGTDDSLWRWGGLSTTVATRFDTARRWDSLDLGVDSACAIAKDGTLWCWGTNLFKQLGLGNVSGSGVDVPTQVGTETDWKQVSMGVSVTCGVRGVGTLWCWGSSSPIGGLVGDGSSIGDRPTPVAIGQASDWTGP